MYILNEVLKITRTKIKKFNIVLFKIKKRQKLNYILEYY